MYITGRPGNHNGNSGSEVVRTVTGKSLRQEDDNEALRSQCNHTRGRQFHPTTRILPSAIRILDSN
jgi:hypothetical protein